MSHENVTTQCVRCKKQVPAAKISPDHVCLQCLTPPMEMKMSESHNRFPAVSRFAIQMDMSHNIKQSDWTSKPEVKED